MVGGGRWWQRQPVVMLGGGAWGWGAEEINAQVGWRDGDAVARFLVLAADNKESRSQAC